MRGSSTPKQRKAGRKFLIFLYALTFYLGPQFGGGQASFEEGALSAKEVTGNATGFYPMNKFNDMFELDQI